MDHKARILIITLEPISAKMAGPAIRAVMLGKTIADQYDCAIFSPTLTPDAPPLSPDAHGKAEIHAGGGGSSLRKLAAQYDVLFIQANVLKPYPFLAEMGKYIIVDLYDPYLFPTLVQYENDPVQADASYRLMHRVLEAHMLAADFAVCASERQRDYWIGRFCALGRIDPRMYRFDKSLRKLIDLVPYGLPADQPQKRAGGPSLRDIQGIAPSDPVLLWGGGVWDWFDPLTPINAVGRLVSRIPHLRLVFMGTRSPNPKVPEMDMTARARRLSADLGLLDKHVFFLDGWVAYEDRLNYLLDADIAISAHFDLPETSYSFRTRILDYLYAGLPILTTRGDELAELIEKNGAGRALDYQDIDGWEKAIEEMVTARAAGITDSGIRSRELSQRFLWENNAKPLLQFLQAPYHSPEHRPITMPTLIERARAVWRRGGPSLILKRSRELLDDVFK